MELEEAKKTMEEFLKDTPKLPYDCIANQEIEAVQTLLNHLTKQEKMIESAKDRIEYYLMGNSKLDDFYEREKELDIGSWVRFSFRLLHHLPN